MEISLSLVSFCVHRRSKLKICSSSFFSWVQPEALYVKGKKLGQGMILFLLNYYIWYKFIYSIPWFFFFVFSCNIVLSRIEALFSYWRPCLIQFYSLRLQVCLFNNAHYVFDYFTLLLFCIFFFFFEVGFGGLLRVI